MAPLPLKICFWPPCPSRSAGQALKGGKIQAELKIPLDSEIVSTKGVISLQQKKDSSKSPFRGI